MKHILLVDDDPGLRQLLLVTLAAPEFLIRQVSSGKMALRVAREFQPDLIILDLYLTPNQAEGLEVCRQLKADPLTARSYILMLTGANRPEDRAAAAAAGADFYFTKPFSPRALLAHIYMVLGLEPDGPPAVVRVPHRHSPPS
jgi:DNA-binding response OmpR family regulator